MRIVFMGTPDFAVPSLKALVEAGHEICGVFTQPDKPKNRGMKLQMPPVKEYSIFTDLKEQLSTSYGKTKKPKQLKQP